MISGKIQETPLLLVIVRCVINEALASIYGASRDPAQSRAIATRSLR